MVKAVIHVFIYILLVKEIAGMKIILFSSDFVYKCNASLHVTHYRCSKLFIVK